MYAFLKPCGHKHKDVFKCNFFFFYKKQITPSSNNKQTTTKCFRVTCIYLSPGVNGACSSDDNPIFLDPSEVIAEYEDEVTLTCNNTDDIQDAIFWQYGTTTSGFLEDTPFISWTLKLTDWNVTKAECMTRLDNALECSKELKITLFSKSRIVYYYYLITMKYAQYVF